MSTPTKAVLEIQSDLKRSSTPSANDDVANVAFVNTAIAATVPTATSANGGGTQGKLTADALKGLHIATGIAEVKIDAATVLFNGSGQLTATIPDATSGVGGGTKGKLTADEAKGLKIAAGIAEVVPDGTSIGFDGSGKLKTLSAPTPDATSGHGGGTKGLATFDEDFGLITAPGGLARVKPDGITVGFDVSGNLKTLGGGGGGPSGLISNRVPFGRALLDGTAVPNPATLGTNISASAYPHGSTTGERFEFTVPDDYFSGGIELMLVYKMSTAVANPNNTARVSTAVELAKITGSIDTATYPETQQTIAVPNNTTNVTRQTILTIAQGTFEAGDEVVAAFKRFGGNGADLHTGDLQLIAFEWRYTGVVNSRLANQVPEFTGNAAGENATTNGNIGTETDVIGFPSGSDAGTKFAGIVPDNWDGFSDCFVSISYAMSTNAGGTVRLNTYGEIANTVGGSLDSIGSVNFDFAAASDTNPHRLLAFAKIPAASLHKGDHITLVLARRTAVGGNSTAQLNIVGITFQFSIAPTAGFTQTSISERYLNEPVFGNSVGTITNATGFPALGSTFDKLFTMTATANGSSLDAAFAGRVATFQTKVKNIRLNIVGTGASPQYQLRIYAEGSGATPVYDSGAQPAPGALAEIVVLDGALSAQPSGSKRYHVVVTALCDNGEAVAISLPFARQE